MILLAACMTATELRVKCFTALLVGNCHLSLAVADFDSPVNVVKTALNSSTVAIATKKTTPPNVLIKRIASVDTVRETVRVGRLVPLPVGTKPERLRRLDGLAGSLGAGGMDVFFNLLGQVIVIITAMEVVETQTPAIATQGVNPLGIGGNNCQRGRDGFGERRHF